MLAFRKIWPIYEYIPFLTCFLPKQNVNAAAIATPRVKRKLPPRSEQVKTLQSGEEYDVIIIGGGATGAGCALDSITRGIDSKN